MTEVDNFLVGASRARLTEAEDRGDPRIQQDAMAYHRERLAAVEAAFDGRPLYWRRSVLRDVATYQAHKAEITTAMREGRLLPDGVPLPEGGREFKPAPPSTRTYTRTELRDPTFVAEHRADILAAQHEGRIVDDTGQQIRRNR